MATAVYRTVQEALTNVTKHAGASRVTVRLESTASTVAVVVQDNGRGFEVEEPAASPSARGGLVRNTREGSSSWEAPLTFNPVQGMELD